MPHTAYLGTFDAERWWRPADLAGLPAVTVADGAAVAARDELLAVCCTAQDVLFTRDPMSAELLAGLAAAGFTFAQHTVDPGDDADATGKAARPIEASVRLDSAARARVAACAVLAPYAVLPDTAELAGELARAHEIPAAGVVAEVNSKVWSNDLVQALGLPGAATVVRSVAELTAAVTARGGTAVLKDPFGVSGRGMLEVGTPGRLRRIAGALERQCAAGRRVELLVQDRYACRVDLSAHGVIGRNASWELLGVQIMSNAQFRYNGSCVADERLVDVLRRRGYFDTVAEVAGALSARGYWGPVCIDSALLVDDTLIPVLEINARRSMGLLCLTLHRRVVENGLSCYLTSVNLSVPPGRGIDDLIGALRRNKVLYDGGARPGVLVLAGSTLAAPGGRVHWALLGNARSDMDELSARAVAALTDAGFAVRGVPGAV